MYKITCSEKLEKYNLNNIFLKYRLHVFKIHLFNLTINYL